MNDEWKDLSEMVEQLATECITSTDHRITFRLFVLGHGPEQDHTKLKPVYSSTCSIRDDLDREPLVMERTIDEDWSLCGYRRGCARCRKSEHS
jgi:hypothetical protein